jgi:hypothetical protein
MPIVVLKPRARLRKFLEEQLKVMEKSGSAEASILRVAVEGLVALDYGEARPIFEPKQKKGAHGGTRPYTLRKLQMQALGFADLLIANKYKPAIRTVAEAYGATAAAFRGWRKDKDIGKTTDNLMKSFREKIAKLDWDQSHILDEIKFAGKKYRAEEKLAHEPKKQG